MKRKHYITCCLVAYLNICIAYTSSRRACGLKKCAAHPNVSPGKMRVLLATSRPPEYDCGGCGATHFKFINTVQATVLNNLNVSYGSNQPGTSASWKPIPCRCIQSSTLSVHTCGPVRWRMPQFSDSRWPSGRRSFTASLEILWLHKVGKRGGRGEGIMASAPSTLRYQCHPPCRILSIIHEAAFSRLLVPRGKG